MKLCLEDFRWSGGHIPTFRRHRLGCAPVSGRPLFGWDCKCQCGWELKSNESKAAVERLWRQHTREEWKKPA